MHIYFSGIGGTAIGPLALIAKQAGYQVSGSDVADSSYIMYLKKHGITDITIGQTADQIAEAHSKNPIDWLVYSSALPMTDPNHPELAFCQAHGIKTSKRDEFLNKIIKDKKMKLIAIAGTHGKTTTTAMVVWVFKQLGLPLSYSVGAKLPFGEMGEFTAESEYFVYEADEYDRNFLSFYPELVLIPGLDYDHPDIYPTPESYNQAFLEFFQQSHQVVIFKDDAQKLALEVDPKYKLLDRAEAEDNHLALRGMVNRQNAYLIAKALQPLLDQPLGKLLDILNGFPGLARRFEQIAPNIYSDYAHTPPKIRGALQLAHEVAGNNVVVVYEGLHNLRQHFIKDELSSLFNNVKQLYVVPSYLARENKDLELLTPDRLLNLLSSKAREHASSSQLDNKLVQQIKHHAEAGDTVLCLSAGGAGSLDEWLRTNFS